LSVPVDYTITWNNRAENTIVYIITWSHHSNENTHYIDKYQYQWR
jgi:hypothetical protein